MTSRIRAQLPIHSQSSGTGDLVAEVDFGMRIHRENSCGGGPSFKSLIHVHVHMYDKNCRAEYFGVGGDHEFRPLSVTERDLRIPYLLYRQC